MERGKKRREGRRIKDNECYETNIANNRPGNGDPCTGTSDNEKGDSVDEAYDMLQTQVTILMRQMLKINQHFSITVLLMMMIV